MNNLNLLCQTIRLQRTALQNSLAMISAVQQHGERLLKSTLDQSPWIPGQDKDAFMFWAGIWRKGLKGATDMVDNNLATMERFTTPHGGKDVKKEQPGEPAQRPATRKASPPEKKQGPEKQQAEVKGSPPAKETEPVAMVKAEAVKTQAAEQLVGKQTEQPPGKQPEEKKKLRTEELTGTPKVARGANLVSNPSPTKTTQENKEDAGDTGSSGSNNRGKRRNRQGTRPKVA